MIRESALSVPQSEREVPGLKEMAGHLFRYVQERLNLVTGFVQKLDAPNLMWSLEKGLQEEIAKQTALQETLRNLEETGATDDKTYWAVEHHQAELVERRQFITQLTERRNALLEKQN